VKLGVLLPTFREGADDAFSFAREAATAHIDGVFAYDHLWPMGSPERPSLAPFALLAAIARRHEELIVGPLVARIGLTGTAHLVEEFETLEALAPGRVIAAVGTGDQLSAPENEAYGIAVQSVDERRAQLEMTARALAPMMPVWIGGGGASTNKLARDLGVVLNLWNATTERLREAARFGEVSYAGPVPDNLFARLSELAEAGATWAVFSPDVKIAQLNEWRNGQ
jgi:alkanesulfonate monooxygenase SsuD/methylene tetrahydromethanopterin reductase-like flavin-dependent oxidoreductase (luciferase family)